MNINEKKDNIMKYTLLWRGGWKLCAY